MTPSVKVHKQGPTFTSLLVFLPPSSEQFNFDRLSIQHKSQESEQWIPVEDVTQLSEVEYVCTLKPEENYTVKVVAHYPGEEISSEDVQVQMPTGGQLFLHLFCCK